MTSGFCRFNSGSARCNASTDDSNFSPPISRGRLQFPAQADAHFPGRRPRPRRGEAPAQQPHVLALDEDAVALWNANLEAGLRVAKAAGAKPATATPAGAKAAAAIPVVPEVPAAPATPALRLSGLEPLTVT